MRLVTADNTKQGYHTLHIKWMLVVEFWEVVPVLGLDGVPTETATMLPHPHVVCGYRYVAIDHFSLFWQE